MNSYRGIEDNFLMYYRFIECFYKRQNNKNTFMKCCIKDHCASFSNKDTSYWEDEAHEIICLRNRYVHSGYYLKNGHLRIKSRGTDKPGYTVNADYDFIYEKTKMLYLMVIDIIFKDMLQIDHYEYKKQM